MKIEILTLMDSKGQTMAMVLAEEPAKILQSLVSKRIIYVYVNKMHFNYVCKLITECLQVSTYGVMYSQSFNIHLQTIEPRSLPISRSGYLIAQYWTEYNYPFPCFKHNFAVSNVENLDRVITIVNQTFGCCFQPEILLIAELVQPHYVSPLQQPLAQRFQGILGMTLAENIVHK